MSNVMNKIKSDLRKLDGCSTTLSEFSDASIFQNKKEIYSFFFRPFILKRKKLREIFIKEVEIDNIKKKPLHQLLDIITSWYFVRGKKYTYEEKFVDFISFCDSMRSNHVPVKLILSEFDKDVNIFGKVYARYNTDFGAIHVALQVGPYIIDWNACGVIVPRPLRVKKCIMVLDLHSKLRCEKKTFQVICDIIWLWNTQFEYTWKKMSYKKICKKKRSNCHGFVDWFCREISARGLPKINLKWYGKNGPIQGYMDYIISRWDKKARSKKFIPLGKVPKGDVEYDGVCEKFLKEKKKKKFRKYLNYGFKNHKTLDEMCVKLLGCEIDDINEKVNVEVYEKYELLKAFDRAFWYMTKRDKDVFDHDKCPLISEKGSGMLSHTRGLVNENKDDDSDDSDDDSDDSDSDDDVKEEGVEKIERKEVKYDFDEDEEEDIENFEKKKIKMDKNVSIIF